MNSPQRVWVTVTIVTLLAVLISVAATAVSLVISGIGYSRLAYIIATIVPALTVPPTAYLLAHYAYRLSLAHEALFHLAHTDELTGLSNRRHFFLQGSKQLAMAQETNKHTVLMLLDADNFKQINDTSGHAAGDEALCFLAQTLNTYVEPGDLVARLGGDEFAVLRSGATIADMATLATHISRRLTQDAFWYKGIPLSLSVSIGIADTMHANSFEQLLRASDVALYQKKLGDDMQFATDNTSDSIREQSANAITQAYRLQNGDFLHWHQD